MSFKKQSETNLWDKLFYTPPRNWVELKEFCKKNCDRLAPNMFETECRSCMVTRDCLEQMGELDRSRPVTHQKYPKGILGEIK